VYGMRRRMRRAGAVGNAAPAPRGGLSPGADSAAAPGSGRGQAELDRLVHILIGLI
jgi:hypothetical protein